jgi:hypothetical protein
MLDVMDEYCNPMFSPTMGLADYITPYISTDSTDLTPVTANVDHNPTPFDTPTSPYSTRKSSVAPTTYSTVFTGSAHSPDTSVSHKNGVSISGIVVISSFMAMVALFQPCTTTTGSYCPKLYTEH